MSDHYIFAGQQYYPSGGAKDLVATCCDLETAKNLLPQLLVDEKYDWYQIADSQMRIVEKYPT